MRIIITAEEAIDMGIWEEVADIAGYDYYAVNEGMDGDTEISLTKEQAKQLRLI
jgi:hypothetical protein